MTYTYENLMELSIKYNFTVNNSQEQIEKTQIVDLISKCGHNTITTMNKLIKKKIGIYCNNCMDLINNTTNFMVCCSNSKCKKIFISSPTSFLFCSKFCSYSKSLKDATKKKISESNSLIMKNMKTYNLIELLNDGNKYVKNLINEHFEYEITNRCCSYNHIIKPKNNNPQSNNNENENDNINFSPNWLPIKTLYSNCSDDYNYFFSLKKNNTSQILLCINILHNKIWLFPPNVITYCTKLKISKNKSDKYNDYLILPNEFVEKLSKFYNENLHYYVVKNEDFYFQNDNIKSHIKVEHEYVKKRLEKIKYINFQNSITKFETYNFLINDFRIQEAVCFVTKDLMRQIACIHKQIDNHCIPFSFNDNDFYWINERITDNFYVIPSQIMYNNGFLSSHAKNGKTTITIETNYTWLQYYLFSYTTIDEPEQKYKLLQLFNK